MRRMQVPNGDKINFIDEDKMCVVKEGDEVDPMWGGSYHYITKAQLMEFLEGGSALYCSDGEYCHLIYLKEEK